MRLIVGEIKVSKIIDWKKAGLKNIYEYGGTEYKNEINYRKSTLIDF
jgi:hypothetical protein